jgi:hypothetical protein
LKTSSQSSQSQLSSQSQQSQGNRDLSVSPEPSAQGPRRRREMLEEMSEAQYKNFRVL